MLLAAGKENAKKFISNLYSNAVLDKKDIKILKLMISQFIAANSSTRNTKRFQLTQLLAFFEFLKSFNVNLKGTQCFLT